MTDKIEDFWLKYFREDCRLQMFSGLSDVLDERPDRDMAYIATRLGKNPIAVEKALTSAGNLEMDVASDIAVALGYRLKINFEKLEPGGDERLAEALGIYEGPEQ